MRGGAYDPRELLTVVMRHLAWRGCWPELGTANLATAEAVAGELLRLLAVEPEPLDRMRYGDYGNSGPGW